MRQTAAITVACIALSSAGSAQVASPVSLYRDEHWLLHLHRYDPFPVCFLMAAPASNGEPRRRLVVYVDGKHNIARIEINFPPPQYLAANRQATVAIDLGPPFARSIKFRLLLKSAYPVIAARLSLGELEDLRRSLDGTAGAMNVRFENGEAWRLPPPRDRKLASAAANCWASAMVTDPPPGLDEDAVRCERHLSGCADASSPAGPRVREPLTALARLFITMARMQYLYSRGNDHLHKKEYDRAIEYFDRAIRIEARFEPVFNQRGIAYLRSERYDHAFADFDKAVHLNPTYAIGFSNRGLVYNKKKEYGRAIRDFDRAIRLEPENSESFRGRGIAKHAIGDIPGGDQDLQRAIDLARRGR